MKYVGNHFYYRRHLNFSKIVGTLRGLTTAKPNLRLAIKKSILECWSPPVVNNIFCFWLARVFDFPYLIFQLW